MAFIPPHWQLLLQESLSLMASLLKKKLYNKIIALEIIIM